MMGGEWCEPVYGEIVCPDDEDWYVDGEDPDHEDEDGVGVVVEIIVGSASLFLCLANILLTIACAIDELTVSLTKRSARVQVDSCTRTASKYAN